MIYSYKGLILSLDRENILKILLSSYRPLEIKPKNFMIIGDYGHFLLLVLCKHDKNLILLN